MIKVASLAFHAGNEIIFYIRHGLLQAASVITVATFILVFNILLFTTTLHQC
jgi:hypothetical protein